LIDTYVEFVISRYCRGHSRSELETRDTARLLETVSTLFNDVEEMVSKARDSLVLDASDVY